jgi:hypothetical protein
MNADQAKIFVEANSRLISETNHYGRCVDGRYYNIPDCPMIAKPGGDLGDVIAILAGLNLLQATLPLETVLAIVERSVGGIKNFNFHTDDHADPNEAAFGCGHYRHAKLDPAAYGVTTEQMSSVAAALPALMGDGAHQEVLHGSHGEQAVIVVDSEHYGLLPMSEEGEVIQQVFVYQKTLHTKQLDKMVRLTQEAIAGTGRVVEEQELRTAIYDGFGKQLAETLNRLAKGLPVYTAEISEDGAVNIVA